MEWQSELVGWIFNLLSAARWLAVPSFEALNRALQKRGVDVRQHTREINLAVWLGICQAASLVDDRDLFQPTWFVADWLGWTAQRQVGHLLRAWAEAVSSSNYRRLRKRLIKKLKERLPLTATDLGQLPCLRAMGIVSNDQLSPQAEALFKSQPDLADCRTPQDWLLDGFQLQVAYPPDWRLLWQLEAFLDPVSEGQYLLDDHALQLALQRGVNEALPGERLVEIIEMGLRQPAPCWLKAKLEAPKSLQLRQGILVEFGDPGLLLEFRRSRRLRSYLQEVITPRHVLVKPWNIYRLAGILLRRGLIAGPDYHEMLKAIGDGDLPDQDAPGKTPGQFTLRDGLSANERAYLLCMILLADEGLKMPASPPGLRQKLTGSLPVEIQSSVARRAERLMKSFQQVRSTPLEEAPDEPPVEMVERLKEAIMKGETIEIEYQAVDQDMPRKRRIDPLLIEKRGGQAYLVAYCHLRSENRTFRLDRLRLLESKKSS